MPDRIVRRLFQGRSHIVLQPDDLAVPIRREDIPRFVGALDGSVVTVTSEEAGIGYRFEITHPWLMTPMQRVLWWDPQGAMRYLLNEEFHLKPRRQGRGYGIRSLALELTTAQAYGVATVSCMAAGGPGQASNGYYTWAVAGFDADLLDTYAEALSGPLAGCATLNELIRRPGGAAHWKATGYSDWLTFDLSRGSASWDILREYMKFNGIQL